MLHRLCGPPSIPLSFILANVLPRWITYRFLLNADIISPTSSDHRLRRGLPGYLILFAPHAFVPQRQYCARMLPSPSVFLLISTHVTATPGIPHSSHIFYFISFDCRSPVKPVDLTINLIKRLRTLYAQLFRTTLAPLVLPRLLARS